MLNSRRADQPSLGARLDSPAISTRICRLRVYSYPDLLEPLHALLDFEAMHAPKHCSPMDDFCQSNAFTGIGSKNRRQYSADLPIWRALRACPSASAEEADIFLVPFLFSSSATLKWGEYWGWTMRQQIAGIRQNGSDIMPRLSHLNARSARRHVLLWTMDVEFVGGFDGEPLPGLDSGTQAWLAEATIVHLGDDEIPARSSHNPHVRPLRNGLTVPYRVSQWCPLGFPLLPQRKMHLLFANVNPSRHATRGLLASSLLERARELGVESRLMFAPANTTAASAATSSPMLSPREAAEHALISTFCLCPTGDSKGFTARFYFSIAVSLLPYPTATPQDTPVSVTDMAHLFFSCFRLLSTIASQCTTMVTTASGKGVSAGATRSRSASIGKGLLLRPHLRTLAARSRWDMRCSTRS